MAAFTAVLLVLLAPPVWSADINGDDERDRYVGTGGLLLPGTVGTHERAEVASCLGCQWRLSSPCLESDAGNAFSGTPTCLSVVRGCPNGSALLRAWFSPSDGQWREIGLVCIGPSGPVTVVDLGTQVRDDLARSVPAQRVAFQPRRGVVTQLPVIFDSGQDADGIHEIMNLAGESIELRARPTWRWEFGDGAWLATRNPGAAYPNLDVAHPYRVAGSYRVQLRTTWSAEFTVDGIGPFPVVDPVTQTASVDLRVGEGRAVLTGR